eukprot:9373342-Alexandrium_andersonii.AAC.1
MGSEASPSFGSEWLPWRSIVWPDLASELTAAANCSVVVGVTGLPHKTAILSGCASGHEESSFRRACEARASGDRWRSALCFGHGVVSVVGGSSAGASAKTSSKS